MIPEAREVRLRLPGRGSEILVLGYGIIPSVLLGTNQLSPAIQTIDPWLTVLTSMFLHGFGRAVETRSARSVMPYSI